MKHCNPYLLFGCLGILAFTACTKEPEINNLIKPSTAHFYFQAQVDGKDVAIELLTGNNVELFNSNDAYLNPPECAINYGVFIGKKDALNGPVAGLDLIRFFTGDCGDEGSEFNQLFSAGNYPFVDSDALSKSVVVRYNDGTGFYSSANGPQTDAAFTITGSESANDEFGAAQIVSGTFQCQVYSASGGKRTLTNGTFKLQFRPWF